MSRFWRKVGASRLLARCVRASNGLSGVEGGCRATQGVCETGRRAVQSPIWDRAQFGLLSNQKSKRQDTRSIVSDRARMQAGSEAMGTPMGHSLHGLSPHVGADGRHGGTATAWKSAKIGHFCCPNSGQPLLLPLQQLQLLLLLLLLPLLLLFLLGLTLTTTTTIITTRVNPMLLLPLLLLILLLMINTVNNNTMQYSQQQQRGRVEQKDGLFLQPAGD